jgi:DNA-binding LacI/PurR family transcriptional regulator
MGKRTIAYEVFIYTQSNHFFKTFPCEAINAKAAVKKAVKHLYSLGRRAAVYTCVAKEKI